MVDIRIKKDRSLLDQTRVKGSVRLHRSSCVHSDIRLSIRHFVVGAIMMSLAEDINIVSDGARFLK